MELDFDERLTEDMIRRSSFEFVTGRGAGTENTQKFYRKGVQGDWANHFSDEDRHAFASLAGNLLIQLGYENDPDPSSW